MKTVLFFFVFFLMLICTNHAQDRTSRMQLVNEKQFHDKVQNLIYTLNEWHVSPLNLDDTLSGRVFHLFVRDFDPYLLFMTREYEQQLEEYQYELDDQIKTGNYSFLDSCTAIAYSGMLHIEEEWLKEINLEFVLSEYDSVLFTKNRSARLASDQVGLKKRFDKWISYRVLKSTYNNFPLLNLDDEDSVAYAVNYSIEQEKANLSCLFQSMGYPDKNKIKRNLQDLFLNDIAAAYDPHSNFFSVDEKNQLETMLSPSEDSFGIYLIDEDNTIKIYSIHRHSDAWKSNLLNEGDIIKQATDQNGKELIDQCTSAYDLESILASTEVETISLTVIKSSGKEINVELIKESLSSEENNLVAYVLKGSANIGYISLPSFYTSWEDGKVDGCANDVAKEIIKLKEDNIEGLILDLRNNGGGSVMEALGLAGIFIDIGPIGIVKGAKEKPKLMKDFNRGAAYTGPLVVLINGGSASASEIVAGALKYHRRAIIVGSESFGKATGQIVLPTDSTEWYTYDNPSSEDFVKVTISNIYQPDLNSHQLYGIKPDIYLPDLWESFYTKEADEDYPLVPGKIQKNVYFTPTLSLPLETLIAKSNERVSQEETFKRILTINDSLTSSMNKSFKLSMKLPAIYTYNNQTEKVYERLFEETELDSADFDFSVPMFYQSISAMDKSFQKNALRLKFEMEKDPVLNETFLILMDFIKLND